VLTLRLFQSEDYDALISWFPNEQALRDFAGPSVRWPLDHPQLLARHHEPGLRSWTAHRPPATEPIGHIEMLQTAQWRPAEWCTAPATT
jgi:hypothetical protein